MHDSNGMLYFRFGSLADYAPQKAMCALPLRATAKADSRKGACPLYPERGALAYVW